MPITISKTFEWDAAHRVLRHESKCSTIHGHRYRAELSVTAAELDSVGRVIDFGVLKERVGAWIDKHLDHTAIVNSADQDLLDFCNADAGRGKRAPYVMIGEPTAENIASMLLAVARTLLVNTEIEVVSVKVWETPTCTAIASAQ